MNVSSFFCTHTRAKILVCILIFVFGSLSTQAAEKYLFATITSPNTATDLSTAGKDPTLLPEKTFAIRGVAQPNTFLNLYGWSIIPGTDGETNPHKAITGFTGEVITSEQVKLSWKPRVLFQAEFANSIRENAGLSCEMLKTHCSPSGNESVGVTSTQCPQGNVPLQTDCTFPQKYSVYTDIIDPLQTAAGSGHGKIALEFSSRTEQEESETINNTQFLDPRCQDCEYEFYPVGWKLAMSSSQPLSLLDENLQIPPPSTLFVDRANGSIPFLNEQKGRAELEHIFKSGKYAPPIDSGSYSGVYPFSYFNFVRAYSPLWDYGAAEAFPIKDTLFLVDGFEQYEIYAQKKEEYAAYTGVTRENGTLIQIIRDPSLTETIIDYRESNLDPNTEYVFSIFEVRESETISLPLALTQQVSAKTVPAASCLGRGNQNTGCSAQVGHLSSANTEVVVNSTGRTVNTLPSPPKKEWEVFEQEGKYTKDPIRTDHNGEIKSGLKSESVLSFPEKQLNRLASHRFFTATYPATTLSESRNPNAFSVFTNKAVVDLESVYSISNQTAYSQSSSQIAGVVFNSWTQEIIGGVTLALQGTTTETSQSVTMQQKTASDGLFTFQTASGEYTLSPTALAGKDNTFIFPSGEYRPQNNDSCGADGIFENIYCEPLSFSFEQASVHRQVAVDPAIKGEIQNTDEPVTIVLTQNNVVIERQESLPHNGKFSFFVSPGNYTISQILDSNGTSLLEPKMPITISADSNGNPISSVPITLSL